MLLFFLLFSFKDAASKLDAVCMARTLKHLMRKDPSGLSKNKKQKNTRTQKALNDSWFLKV